MQNKSFQHIDFLLNEKVFYMNVLVFWNHLQKPTKLAMKWINSETNHMSLTALSKGLHVSRGFHSGCIFMLNTDSERNQEPAAESRFMNKNHKAQFFSYLCLQNYKHSPLV